MHKIPYEMLHLGHLAHIHLRLCYTRFADKGITRGMPFMLDYLMDHEGCIQRELARRWHLDPASVTSVMTQMESEGLVERRPVPGDKRALQVFLTALGKEKAGFVNDTHREIEKKCFEGFSAEERAAFKDMLDRIEENMMELQKEREDA